MTDQVREDLSFDEMLDRIGELVEEFEGAAPELSRESVLELLDYLEAWHREGIIRLATSVPQEALERAREDPIVAHLLDTYLSEDDEDDPAGLIDGALEEIRPYVHSHGGEMEVISVEAGVVTLRLMGSCDGCPSSSLTLTQGVEGILRERWPAFRRLQVEGDGGEAGHGHGHGGPPLLQIQSLKKE